MLLHDNYILFLVNLKAVLKLRCKVKCTYCLLYEECIFVMAESDKTLKEDVNLSNNSRNNSVPNIVPISSGTVNSDTHPTHHAAVSEPSTLKRKQTSFQITSVTVKGSRLSTDGGEDSADDLDESHTEDASSDILDCSRNTDVDNDQFSEDNTANHDDGSCTAPSTAVKCKSEMPDKKITSNDVVKLPSGALKTEELSMPSENTPSDFVKPTALPDQWQHRFRVVKIVSSEPFKRGRWLCLDFVDPPAPVTEAKAEIVESSVSHNIQLISSSLPESIPADKIAHIYEISPGDAYPGSISVAVGSDKVQQPMYGIFLPINNGQYPLITGMHSKAVARPMDKEVHESMKPVKSSEQGNQSQCLVSSAQPTPNISSAMQNSMNVTPSIQQTQQNVPVGSNINTASNYQQQQNISSSNFQQQPTNSSSNFQPQQNISSNVQAVNNCMQQQPTTSTAQQPNVTGIHQNLSTNVGQQSIPTQQASSVSSNMPPHMATPTKLPEVKSVQSQNINSSMLQPQHNVLLQSQQNVNVPSAQNISSNMPQTISSTIQQNLSTSMQSHQNVNNNVEMQYQNVGNVHVPPSVNNIQSQPNASSVPSQQNASTTQQPKVSGNLSSQHVSSNLNQHDSSSVQPVSIPQQPQNAPIGIQQTQNVMEGFQHAQTTMGNLQPAHTSQQPQNASVSQSGMETQQVLVNQPMQQGNTFQQQQPKPVQPIPAVSVSLSSNVDPKLVTQHPSSSSEPAPPHTLNITSNVSQVQLSRESQQGMQVSHPVHSTTSQVASSTVSNTPLEVSSAPLMAEVAHISANQSTLMQAQQSVAQTTTVGTQASSVSIPEMSTVPSGVKQETVVPSQAIQNHIEANELGTPTSANVSQESAEVPSSKSDINGEESDSVPSGTSTVAIDNKIEQAMDLVKSHLMFAVREEVDVLKEKITELMDRISQLEYENSYLRANASQQTLEQLNQSQLLQQQQNQPLTVSMNSIPAVSQQSLQQTQINIQNQQPTS